LPSSLKEILGLYGGDMYDPYEMAAMRQRRSVRPPGGRSEGEFTRVFAEEMVPRALELNSQLNPIDLVSRAARATTGDLLFPLERLTKYRMERDGEAPEKDTGSVSEPTYEKDQSRFTSGQMAGQGEEVDSRLNRWLDSFPAMRRKGRNLYENYGDEGGNVYVPPPPLPKPRPSEAPSGMGEALRFLMNLDPSERALLFKHFGASAMDISRAVDPKRVGD
jgi:hypothetical protein